MNISRSVKICGTGQCMPEKKVKSADLEKTLGLPQGWSSRYSGVNERYHVVNESNADLAVGALNQALENADLEINDIDFIISASATFDYVLPFQSAYIIKNLCNNSNLNIPSMDIGTTCLSFVSAFDVASSMLNNANYKRIAIVSSEVSSKCLNPEKKETATLFGDGAAAVIIESDEKEDHGIIKSLFKSYPEGFDYSIVKGGGNKYPFKKYPFSHSLHSFSMEGRHLLRLAKRTLPEFFDEFFQDLDIQIEDVDVIVTHQASKAGLKMFRHLFPNIQNQMFSNLETHGNCISASIPIALHQVIENKMLKKDKLCLLCGTAAGFAIGGVLFKY